MEPNITTFINTIMPSFKNYHKKTYFSTSIKYLFEPYEIKLTTTIVKKIKAGEINITQEQQEKVIEHTDLSTIFFNTEVINQMTKKSIHSTCEKLLLIYSDSVLIDKEDIIKLKNFFNTHQYPNFLALAFHLSLRVPNTIVSSKTTAQELKKQGLSVLINNIDENKVGVLSEKFKNISNKTGQYFVPKTLYQKRTSRKNRVLMPYEHVLQSGLTIEQLKDFEGDVVVEFLNNEFFHEYDSEEKNDLFEELKNKLGSNEKVSAMIDIRSTGTSDSREQRKALENLANFLIDEKLLDSSNQIEKSAPSDSSPIVTKIKENSGDKKDKIFIQRNTTDYTHMGNDKWQGFVHYHVSGGNQETYDSHKDNDIGSVLLFNPSIEYASENVSLDISLVLIYFALFSIDMENRNEYWDLTKDSFDFYFKTKKYENYNLYDYVSNHVSLNIKKGELYDPIQVKRIKLSDFTLSDRNDESIDLTHQNSVKRAAYEYDNCLKEILTPANPFNLFWSKHLSNMMQQDFSLKEYFEMTRRHVDSWDHKVLPKKIDDFL